MKSDFPQIFRLRFPSNLVSITDIRYTGVQLKLHLVREDRGIYARVQLHPLREYQEESAVLPVLRGSRERCTRY